MKKEKKSFSIGTKIYLYVGITVFLSSMIVAVISYMISANRIDRYFKGLTLDTARNFATMVDVDYLHDLKKVAASSEYQELRNVAEENDDEQLIEDYLREKGMWDKYASTREMLCNYLSNMDDVKYLYVVVTGNENAMYDMYLIDDDENPIYETGYYEEREAELLGTDFSKEVEPTISNGDWGWLCSAFVPVYNDEGLLVCNVGCDVGMDEIMQERRMNLIYIIAAAVIITGAIIAGVMLLIRKSLIKPLDLITSKMKSFSPSDDHDYEKSGVINLNIKSNDEIEDIYNEIRSMQVRILDYLDDITAIQKEKEQAESDVRRKVEEIGEISKEAYRDALTSVGSKVAYVKKTEELDEQIKRGNSEFAIVMVDVNFLKSINDKYGHAAGDEYLKGCCTVVCQVYKHSPVYRIGGDEFVVILTGSDYESRHDRLRQMQQSFDRSYKNMDLDPWMRCSAASGMAEYSDGDPDAKAVFDRADRSMYDEKARFKKANGLDPSKRTHS